MIISLSIIFTSIALLGVPTGVQRLLGKSFSEKLYEQTKVFVKASLILLSVGIFATSLLLLILGEWILAAYDIDMVLIFIAILLVISSVLQHFFRATAISSLKTKIIPITGIVSGIVKIVSAIILVSIGMETLGVVIGFTLFFIISAILLAVNLSMILKSSEIKSEIKIKNAIRITFSSSVVTWIPDLIRRPGFYLGTIIVFGTIGASQAGIYFITFSIANALITIVQILLTYGLPLLSGMNEGRKKLAWRLTKMSLVFGLPITTIVMFFPNNILQVFGKDYLEGSFVLQILLLSILPVIVGRGIMTLVYAYGNYSHVLAIGLAMNLPRIVLYFILVPMYGISGAAFSFTIGSLIGFIVSLVIAKKVGMKISPKDLMILFFIPTILGLVLSYYEMNFVLSIIIILLVSYISYLRIGIISRDDLNDSILILPNKISGPTLKILNKFAKKINPSY